MAVTLHWPEFSEVMVRTLLIIHNGQTAQLRNEWSFVLCHPWRCTCFLCSITKPSWLIVKSNQWTKEIPFLGLSYFLGVPASGSWSHVPLPCPTILLSGPHWKLSRTSKQEDSSVFCFKNEHLRTCLESGRDAEVQNPSHFQGMHCQVFGTSCSKFLTSPLFKEENEGHRNELSNLVKVKQLGSRWQ